MRRSIIIKIIITALLVFFIYRFFDIQFEDILLSIRNADKHYFIIALLMMPVTMILQIIKWFLLLQGIYKKIAFVDAAVSHLAGMTLGIVTPARLGEFGRAFFLRKLPKTKVVGLTLVDKFYSTLSYFSVGMLSSWIMLIKYEFDPIFQTIAAAISVLLFLFVLFAILNPPKIGRSIMIMSNILPKKDIVRKIGNAVSDVKMKKVLIVYTLACVVWLSVSTQLWLLISAFEQLGSVMGIVIGSTANFFKTLMPITFGEMGVREASMIYFYGKEGISESAAAGAALLIFLINVLIPALIGATFLGRLKVGKNNEAGHDTGKA